VRTIDRTGGTFLHTSRTNPGPRPREGHAGFLADQAIRARSPTTSRRTCCASSSICELDALIAIGGDDTLSYARRLHEEGFAVIAIPKTMDNDVHGTDYCIGFSTAVTRSVEFIHQLRTSTGSHERLAVVELFGRYSGETSLISAYLASVDRALISEVPFDPERLAALLMDDKRANPSNYAMCTVSEGATILDGEVHLSGEEDPYGHRKLGGIGQTTGQLLKEITGQDIITQELGYLMRSGRPDSLDLMVATNFAVMAADHAMNGEHGRMMALRGGTYTNVPLMATVTGRGEAGRRRRALRRRRLPAEGAPGRGQADVPVLRWSPPPRWLGRSPRAPGRIRRAPGEPPPSAGAVCRSPSAATMPGRTRGSNARARRLGRPGRGW
jgi:ATP-dependent phosphofructokinase / diphosphate-dependent phosphofructokinase